MSCLILPSQDSSNLRASKRPLPLVDSFPHERAVRTLHGQHLSRPFISECSNSSTLKHWARPGFGRDLGRHDGPPIFADWPHRSSAVKLYSFRGVGAQTDCPQGSVLTPIPRCCSIVQIGRVTTPVILDTCRALREAGVGDRRLLDNELDILQKYDRPGCDRNSSGILDGSP